MNTIYLSSAIADIIAQSLPEEDLPLAAALFTAIGDQLAFIAVCLERSAPPQSEAESVSEPPREPPFPPA